MTFQSIFDVADILKKEYWDEMLQVVYDNKAVTADKLRTGILVKDAIVEDLDDKGFSVNDIADFVSTGESFLSDEDMAYRFTAYKLGLSDDFTNIEELNAVLKDYPDFDLSDADKEKLVEIYNDYLKTDKFLPTDRDREDERDDR